jgi:hypothetical protein
MSSLSKILKELSLSNEHAEEEINCDSEIKFALSKL